MPTPNNSLRKKLIFIAMVTTTVTLVLSILAFVSLEYYIGQKEIKRKLNILGNVIASQTGTALMFQDRAILQNNLDALVVDKSILRGCLYNDLQKIVIAYHAPDANISCPDFLHELHSYSGLNFQQNYPIVFNQQTIGTLYLEASHTEFLSRIKTFSGFTAMIFIITFLLAIILTNSLQMSVVGPIKNLGKTLRNIMHKKDYSIRADKHNYSELSELIELFNSLLHAVELENSSLKDSEERFRKLTALSPVGIFQVNCQSEFEYVNQRWRDIHAAAEYLPSFEQWRNYIHPDDQELFTKNWEKLINNQESISIELRVIRRDERTTWLQLLMSTLHDQEGDLLGYLGAILDITELKQAQLQMETLAFYDALTGLANRRLFRDRLKKAISHSIRNRKSAALMFIDMDQFKRINDTLGHDAGDVLLREVAKRLQSNVRDTDTVSRVGGDEFTVILTDFQHSHDVLLIAEKLLHTLAQPMNINGHRIITTVSIGITLIPDDSTDDNALLKNADLAMYRAKELGRNNIQFFSEEMNRSVLEHIELEQELKEALKHQQFMLVFQPKISLKDNAVCGVETLLRWKHPEKGYIGPDKFIPIAEETGAIIDIGRWVLSSSCVQMGKLLKRGDLPSHARVAVNLSTKQFTDPDLLPIIKEILASTEFPPKNLELEITESIIMEDVQGAISIMKQLKELGVSIAIDDFGTGYSSLSYIKRFPIDALKVDRSFVKDIPDGKADSAITSAIIAMAHKLNLSVVAEGVETTTQLEFLIDNSCDEIQGFLYSRPLTISQLENYLENFTPEVSDLAQ